MTGDNEAVKEERPLVTFALFAYNQEKYIREAVEGAFSQTYEPLEIILSDDCSTDRTFEIMQEMAAEYLGTHKITLNKNEHNLGIGKHVQVIFSQSAGEIIVAAAGDDLSHSDRATRCVDMFRRNPGTLVFISGYDYFDAESKPVDGLWIPCPKEYSIYNFARGLINVPGAAAAWHKSLIIGWPSLDGVIHEDRVLPFRALLLGGKVVSVNETLVTYRSIGGVSRFNGGYTRYNQREVRRWACQKILPDAYKRIEDYEHSKYNNRKITYLLKKEISLLKEEISALNCKNWIFDVKYIFISIKSLKLSILKKYIKIRLCDILNTLHKIGR